VSIKSAVIENATNLRIAVRAPFLFFGAVVI